MIELSGLVLIMVGACFAAWQANDTWNPGVAIAVFFGTGIAGFFLFLLVPIVGFLAGAAPAVVMFQHARSTKFRQIADEPDDHELLD